MTIQLIEGFDHMGTTALLAGKGWVASGGTQAPVTGRVNGFAWQMTRTGTNASFTTTKSIPTMTQFVMGFAYKPDKQPAVLSDVIILKAGATSAVRIGIDSGGHMVIRNSGGTTIATGTGLFAASSWHYAEVKIVINGASGSVATQFDGAADIASTTGNFGSTGVNSVLMALTATGGNDFAIPVNLVFDDMYIIDTSASPNNNFLGDVCVQTIVPDGDGAHTQWTPNSGTNHFDRVNELSGTYPDGDTTYVFDASVGDRDSYTYGSILSLTGTIYGVQTNLYARKDDAGTRQICAVARPSSTDYDGSTVTLATTYADFTEIRETNPETSAAWTVSDINACEFGVKVVA